VLIGITTTLVAGWRSCSCADKRAKTILERPRCQRKLAAGFVLSSKQQTADKQTANSEQQSTKA